MGYTLQKGWKQVSLVAEKRMEVTVFTHKTLTRCRCDNFDLIPFLCFLITDLWKT